MSYYTVNSGDTLWNVVKREYKLSNNTDIANKVNELAKKNNISDPNKIKIVQKIELFNSSNNKDVKTATQTTTPENVANTASNAVKQRISYNNINSYDDLNKLASSSVSIFGSEIQTEAQKEQAYLDYSEGLLNEYYDINKDGKVTVEEFAEVEKNGAAKAGEIQGDKLDNDIIAQLEKDDEALSIYDLDGDKKISIDEYRETLKKYNLESFNNQEVTQTIAERSGNLFAKNLDMNADGVISKQELAFFNQNADGLDGAADGVISNAGESAMFGAITGMNARDKKINAVVNKYLQGADLTEEEQKILEQSTGIIRTNMSKAAGLDTEE